MYALITKKRRPDIVILSKTEDGFIQALDTLYWNHRGMQAQGIKFELEDMMKKYGYKKVRIQFKEWPV